MKLRECRVGQFYRYKHNRLALYKAPSTKAKHSDNCHCSPTDRFWMTGLFHLEYTVPASMLATVTLSLPWLLVLVGQIAWRRPAVSHQDGKIDPFVLALSIHRVIREVMFDSLLSCRRSVSRPQIAHSHKICVDASKLGNIVCENQTRKNPLQVLYP